jgi:hypothetical protein|tara:strand:+ start:56 stop:247 length:192 start_codon:yes stop_codon:yes gene_type:complete
MRNPELLERRLTKLNSIFKHLHFLVNRHDSSKEEFESTIKTGEEISEEIASQIEREMGITRNG